MSSCSFPLINNRPSKYSSGVVEGGRVLRNILPNDDELFGC